MSKLALVGSLLAALILAAVLIARAKDAEVDTPRSPLGAVVDVAASRVESSAEAEAEDADEAANATADAEASAISVVASTGDVVAAGFISRRELVESFCTERFGPTFASESGRAIDAMLLELGARDVERSELALLEEPVTATSTVTAAGVQVRVWSVLVVAARGAGPARQVWRTVTVDMVEVDGRWLVDGWVSQFGPTPAAPAEAPIDAAEPVAVVLGWDRTQLAVVG